MARVAWSRLLFHRRTLGWLGAALLAAAPLSLLAGAPPPPAPYDDPQIASTDVVDEIPAHLSVIDGSVALEREGSVTDADENMPLIAGDRLRTEDGRAEIMFGDGSVLDFDQDTDLDFLSESLLRLSTGRVRLLVARAGGDEYRIDAAGATTTVQSAGEYEIAIDDRGQDPEVHVTVVRGAAELRSPYGTTMLRAGLEARASADRAPSSPFASIVARGDAFDRWVLATRDDRVGTRSAQYLPPDLRSYSGAFDRYGDWQYDSGYGYVWYPRVAYDWEPYSDGRWVFAGSFGWTWVGGGLWNWPTHHYGRWGVSAGRWYWVPDRRWAPAWVSWASAPGYVSWCPLGYDNRPVFGVTTLSVRGGGWRGWTVVPSHVFSASFSVRRYAIQPRNLSLASGSSFALRSSGPSRPIGVRADAGRTSYDAERSRIAAPRTSGVFAGREATTSRTSRGTVLAPRQGDAPRQGNAPRQAPRVDAAASGTRTARTAPEATTTARPGFSRPSRVPDTQSTRETPNGWQREDAPRWGSRTAPSSNGVAVNPRSEVERRAWNKDADPRPPFSGARTESVMRDRATLGTPRAEPARAPAPPPSRAREEAPRRGNGVAAAPAPRSGGNGNDRGSGGQDAGRHASDGGEGHAHARGR